MLKHIQPSQRAKQPIARCLHAAAFVLMHHPTHRPQHLARGVAGGFQQQCVVVIPAKPALRNGVKARGRFQAALHLPSDFQRSKAMPHRIHQIHQQIVHVRQIIKIALRRLGKLLLGRVRPARLGNTPVQPQHRHLARGKRSGNRAVALFHIGKQFMLRLNIIALGIVKQRAQLGGRDKGGRMLRNHPPIGGNPCFLRLPLRFWGGLLRGGFGIKFRFFCHVLCRV